MPDGEDGAVRSLGRGLSVMSLPVPHAVGGRSVVEGEEPGRAVAAVLGRGLRQGVVHLRVVLVLLLHGRVGTLGVEGLLVLGTVRQVERVGQGWVRGRDRWQVGEARIGLIRGCQANLSIKTQKDDSATFQIFAEKCLFLVLKTS